MVDYLRLAGKFAECNVDRFHDETINDLTQIVDYLPSGLDESVAVGKLWQLHSRHADEVAESIQRMRALYDPFYKPVKAGSLLALVAGREYLKPEVKRLAESIKKILEEAISGMFSRGRRPTNEPDLNAKIAAVLNTHRSDLRSEYPASSFACASVVPDHTLTNSDLLIEAKYLRDGTSPSKANEGIAADLTKYPSSSFILFLIYDPGRSISNPRVFKEDIESNGRCAVCVVT